MLDRIGILPIEGGNGARQSSVILKASGRCSILGPTWNLGCFDFKISSSRWSGSPGKLQRCCVWICISHFDINMLASIEATNYWWTDSWTARCYETVLAKMICPVFFSINWSTSIEGQKIKPDKENDLWVWQEKEQFIPDTANIIWTFLDHVGEGISSRVDRGKSWISDISAIFIDHSGNFGNQEKATDSKSGRTISTGHSIFVDTFSRSVTGAVPSRI